jgi:hypothetical protein
MSSKQREALSDACYAMFNFLKTHYGSCYEEMANALDKAKAALAEPLKNCEVGTVEEQTERFRKFCFAHTHKNGTDFRCHKNCPAKNYIGGWGIPYCQVRWGQLPYESEVNNG